MPVLRRSKKAKLQKPVSRRAEARRTRSLYRQIVAAAVVVAVLLLTAITLWLTYTTKPAEILGRWIETKQAVIVDTTGALGLKLEHIFLEGKDHTPGDALIAALDVNIGQPLLSLNLPEIRQRLEAVGWVKSAMVERQFPDTLFVNIVERTPLAIWQKARKLYLVDEEGVMIEESHLKHFPNLLILVGDDAPLYARSLLEIIHEDPALYKQINAAVRVGERRWNIRFTSGLEVKLPEDHTQKAWRYVIKLNQEKKLFLPGVSVIDLRIADKVYLDMKE